MSECRIIQGDALAALRALPAGCAHCCVTSPPYWGLRDYGVAGQIGLEPTPEAYTARLVEVFAEVRRVLRDDGTLWLNLGDSYAGCRGNTASKPGIDNKAAGGDNGIPVGIRKDVGGLKPKDLVGIPWRVAFALQADGWWLRSDIIWHKPNPMPESVTDRPTKAHEYLFLLSKSERYFYDAEAIQEPTVCDRMRGPALHPDNVSTNGNDGLSRRPIEEVRNKRSVWTINTESYPEAHFATFPRDLVKPCILAGCPDGGVVIDPFAGSGTTLQVAKDLGCDSIGIELNAEYCKLIEKRIAQDSFAFELSTQTAQPARGADGGAPHAAANYLNSGGAQ